MKRAFNIFMIFVCIGAFGYYVYGAVDFAIGYVTDNEVSTSLDNAMRGDSSAQLRLAMIYHHGWSRVNPNMKLAKDWYESAARNGSRTARMILTKQFNEGENDGSFKGTD